MPRRRLAPATRRPPAAPTSARPSGSPAVSAAPTYALVATYACVECFGPLEVPYDFGERHPRASIEAGPQNIWRYARAAAGRDDAGWTSRTCNPGFTRLVRADNLARALGMTGALWVKDDSGNPTHSFKDRVVAVALASAARASASPRSPAPRPATSPTPSPRRPPAPGCGSVVVIPSDLEDGKIVTTAVYGGTLRRGRRLVRRRQPALLRARRRPVTGLGLRQRQPAPVLRGGLEDPRLRDRRAARLAAAGAGRRADRVRLAAHQGRQGLPRARARSAWSRTTPYTRLRRPGHRLLAGLGRVARPATTSCARCGPTPSPSRSRSATRPTARTRSTSCAAPAARSRT